MRGKWPLIGLVVVLVAFAYLFTMNPGQVSFRLLPGGAMKASLALLLLLTFLAGFAVAFVTGIFSEALQSFVFWRHRVRSERRDEAHRLLRQGRWQASLGRLKVARKFLRRAHRKLPQEKSIALELARAEIGQGKIDAAERRLDAILQDEPANPEALSLLLDVHRSRGDAEPRVALLKRWLEAEPDHLPALMELRELHRGAGRWAEAVEVQERVLARTWGREPQARERRLLGELLLAKAGASGGPESLPALRRVVEEAPDCSAGYVALGDALAAGDAAAAERVWLKGYKATRQKALLLRLEGLRLQRGEGEQMLGLYRKLARKDPGVALLRARLLIGLNRPDEALEAVKEASSPAAGWVKGEALFRARSYDAAARAFRESVGAEDGPAALAFGCSACGQAFREWSPSCPRCGAFDALALEPGRVPPVASARRASGAAS